MLNDVYEISMFDIKLKNIMVVNEDKDVNEIQFVLVGFGSSMTHHAYQWHTSGTPGNIKHGIDRYSLVCICSTWCQTCHFVGQQRKTNFECNTIF